MMAPSLDTSLKAAVPIAPSTPVKAVADALAAMQVSQDDAINPTSRTQHDPFLIPTALHRAFSRLSHSSASFLVSNSPIKSGARPPTIDPVTISPVKPRPTDLLTLDPENERMQLMKLALEQAEIKEAYLKQQLRGQQAAIILQLMYCERVRRQLATKEEKQSRAKGKGRVMGDGKAKLLSGDDFVALVIEHEERARREAEEKEARKVARESHSQVMSRWKVADEERKKRNRERTQRFKVELARWEAERDERKPSKPRWTKPKPEAQEKPVPRPKQATIVEANEEDESPDDSGGAGSELGIVVESEDDDDGFFA